MSAFGVKGDIDALNEYRVSMETKHSAVAIIPCTNLDLSQSFYERLGFNVSANYQHQGYRILHDKLGASIHLTQVEPGWVSPERNAHGIYLYSANVEVLAKEFGETAELKPWKLKEFSVSDPSGVQVRIGWPWT